ncbi:GNAT family N-acetyltransferase [Sanguibacter suarezii]|uniref:GNAT family N-acetyltransferase n=1 Tax=Sanguibacter suarezii TaxID=60921 RepID=UPI00082A6669|nr:GNAT family N-acetyltransferase [Sanguibacter suarezii]
MTPWTITPAPLPETLDSPDAWAVLGAARVSADVERRTWGHADLTYPPAMLLAVLRDQQHVERFPLVATASPAPVSPGADDVLGIVDVSLDRTGNTHLASFSVTVDAEHRRVGIGSALLTAAEQLATERGRTTFILDSTHNRESAADDPDALVPPTGSGRFSRTDPAVAFALGHGYTLEQGERYSVLHLPLEDPALVDRLHADAVEAAGDRYRTVTWVDRCPDELVEQFALLATRMSTAIPLAGLDVVEDPWDAARVRDSEHIVTSTGRSMLVTAAMDQATGELVAYTAFVTPRQSELAFQEDTLVLEAHRGHRLGMLVKTVNLRELMVQHPAVRRIHTWNAEENAHMLAINVALGFQPTGVVGMWQKKLA